LQPHARSDGDEHGGPSVLWQDDDRLFCRGWRVGAGGERRAALLVLPVAEHPAPTTIDRLAHEYGLRAELENGWAAQPLDLVREDGRTVLVLEDVDAEPLERLLDGPMEPARFLRLAINIAAGLGRLHQRALIHKDIKPANILVSRSGAEVRFTGFGIASRLPRQSPDILETLAGTLAYMAPEQTGRMNRSIDSRSDLYALGVTFYRMLTGVLPFAAASPIEWVHCHIARRPVAPGERLESVPVPLSQIVMKLLAKTAEERYQTAAGLERDLRRCLAAWEAGHRIDDFPLGQHDTPDRLVIPEKLYGRARELETALAAFDRVVKSGAPELVLVSGYSGIGKSSVVNELHKAIVSPRGLFASGKFEQYKRDIPYATLVQAFQSLVRPLLSKSDAELDRWRGALREALGPNGRLMIDLVPELKLIIGEQPPVAELPPQQAQGRFQLVFRRFIGVFARPDHPLALFLDDLQWLDQATLDLLEDVLLQGDIRHLMLMGAYRDNEVDAAHPLMRKIAAIKHAGGKIVEITLAPLAGEHLGHLIADALRCELTRAMPLAGLVHDKTAGNPFFAIQFLHALAEERLLTFDRAKACWSWDLDRIRLKGLTDNVVALMVGKLSRLPTQTQNALQQLACLGNAAETTMLSIILQGSADEVHAALWPAVRLELVESRSGSYRFVHDRIQEAAYSLIPVSARAEVHLLIGRLLALQTPPDKRDEAIFEIVNQLNRGADLIDSRDEREQLAEFNLLAGKRAKASTAYASALAYFIAGAARLTEDYWGHRHELMFELELHRAECEFLTGALSAAEERLDALSTHAVGTVQRATVVCLRADLYTTLGENARAIAVGLDFLRHLGIHWSEHPTEDEARREYDRIWTQIGSRPIEELINLQIMSDPSSLATLDVLTKVFAAAMYTEANLACLVICRAVNLSLERGNCDGSTFAYVMLGAIAGARFGDYRAGFRFGQLGYELVEQRRLKGFQARVYNQFATHVLPWTRHLSHGRALLRRAFDVASNNGDLTFSAYSRHALTTNLLATGDSLAEVQREVEHGLAVAEKTGFRVVIDLVTIQLALIRTLRGLTPTFGSFNDLKFEEQATEQRLAGKPGLARAEFSYWTRKLQARFLAGDYAAAVNAESKARRLLPMMRFAVEASEYHLYGALSRAASCSSDRAEQRQQHVAALAEHHRQLETWAQNCPANFETRAALVGAEIAHIEGRELDAERLYEQAIRAARANGFVHNEALANEIASRFYAERGFQQIAQLYLRNARYGYLRWGADGKVRQLDELYPDLRAQEPAPAPTRTIGAPVEHLDLATVIKVSEAVSGEIVLGKLIDTLIRTAVEQAGAERGLLVLCRGSEQRIAAEASTGSETILVRSRDEPVADDALPQSVLHYVAHTQESLILEDALAEHPFSTDAYIRRRGVRSILCLPLVNQAKLVGVLYLENNLAPRVFTPTRTAVLKLLASQAAISLENSRLYGDLQEREAKIRQVQMDLAHANRLASMGHLTASIAHEVNQPITGVVTNAEVALRFLDADKVDRDEVRQILKDIVKGGNRASDVIGRLRDLIKKAPPRKTRFDINGAAGEVIELTRGEAGKNGVRIRADFRDGLPLISGDRVQVQQVILNLVLNAIDAMSGMSEGERELLMSSAEAESGGVLVAVRDTGPGLSRATVEHLFEPFHTTKSSGLGLGLSISRSIVEAHGGRLWASANVPRGTVFQFTLPEGDDDS
jgi:predicted ATPase/signal transduction histidine kinase